MNAALVSLGLLLMRLSAAGLMFFGHGLGKIQNFEKLSETFHDPLNMGNKTSLICAIAGEVVCPALVAIGLMTRVAALGAAFTMGVAAFVFHAKDPLFLSAGGATKEPALLYLTLFATLVFTGPGKASLDAAIFRRSRPAMVPVEPPPRNTTRPI